MAAFRWVSLIAGLSLSLDACTALPVGGSESTRDEALLLSMATYGNLMEGQQEWELPAEAMIEGRVGMAALSSSPSDLNAVLLLISQTAAWCDQTAAVIAATMPEGPREAAAAELDRTCAQELATLERRAQALQRGRGKRQSWWRRTVAGRILGWVGRDVVKPALPDVAMALATGGGGLAAKRLFLRQGRQALEKELRSWGGRTLARKGVGREFLTLAGLPPGPERLSQIATGGPAEPMEEAPAVTLSAEEWDELIGVETEPAATEDVFQLPASGIWTAVCKHRWIEPEWTYEWKLALDLGTKKYTYALSAKRDIVLNPEYWIRHEAWQEQGSGTIAEDGILEGTYTQTETYGQTYIPTGESFTFQPEVGKYLMYGTFSTDLGRVCISRGLQPGAFDPSYVRRLGRDLFFAPDKGCEGECTIVGGP